MDHVSRRYLIDVISEHYFDLGKTIQCKHMQKITEEIVEIFPTERKVCVIEIITVSFSIKDYKCLFLVNYESFDICFSSTGNILLSRDTPK